MEPSCLRPYQSTTGIYISGDPRVAHSSSLKPCTPVVHLPGPVAGLGSVLLLEVFSVFAGILHPRATVCHTLLRIHTAEVAGSKPASPTSKKSPFAGKTTNSLIRRCTGFDPFDDGLTTVEIFTKESVLYGPYLRCAEGGASKRAARDHTRVRRRPSSRSSGFSYMPENRILVLCGKLTLDALVDHVLTARRSRRVKEYR